MLCDGHFPPGSSEMQSGGRSDDPTTLSFVQRNVTSFAGQWVTPPGTMRYVRNVRFSSLEDSISVCRLL